MKIKRNMSNMNVTAAESASTYDEQAGQEINELLVKDALASIDKAMKKVSTYYKRTRCEDCREIIADLSVVTLAIKGLQNN